MTNTLLLFKAQAIVARCGTPSGKGDPYEWPNGRLSHFIAAFGEDNCYAEPEGAICGRCVEALLVLLRGAHG